MKHENRPQKIASKAPFAPLCFVLVVCTPSLVGAAPSLWDRARDPSAAAADQALSQALRARFPADIPADVVETAPDEFRRHLALEAATILEMMGGESFRDAELLFFLGDALIAADRGRDEDGRRILEKALGLSPRSPEASRAWFDIAIADNRLFEFDKERIAYSEALRVEWDKNKRAEIFMNRGEASMALADLAAARDDFLTVLGTTDDSEIHALSSWDLAVALARDDDLPHALEYARVASQMTFPDSSGHPITALELTGVFFTPDYEVFYYRALSEMAAAEYSDDPKAKRTSLEAALEDWRKYEANAEPHGDRWLTNAEYQRKWTERRLKRLSATRDRDHPE